MKKRLTPEHCLPVDRMNAMLVGRAWSPSDGGPLVVALRGDDVLDMTRVAPTMRDLLELEDSVASLRAHITSAPRIGAVTEVLANSSERERDHGKPWLLAPCDLQAVKAAGVTFVSSMLERVIEEQARGDPAKAEAVRRSMVAILGNNLAVKPGSPQAERVKQALIEQRAWSQYLEVGIGPDAEIFTKSQPMSSVGQGADIGIHPKSEWNNPEPEIVLAVDSRGRTVGATLGNDVNLRDFEGRSALLLGKAKDNTGSCAIGPFIRLFDEHFGIDEVRQCELAMRVDGPEGFVLQGSSSMRLISRDPLDLVSQAIGPNHQYPDGLVLFMGTMFAPTQDRLAPGQGFTHVVGDIVTVSTPRLGALVNRVERSDRVAAWTFGAGALAHFLVKRAAMRR